MVGIKFLRASHRHSPYIFQACCWGLYAVTVLSASMNANIETTPHQTLRCLTSCGYHMIICRLINTNISKTYINLFKFPIQNRIHGIMNATLKSLCLPYRYGLNDRRIMLAMKCWKLWTRAEVWKYQLFYSTIGILNIHVNVL